jgi:hypothetical protein
MEANMVNWTLSKLEKFGRERLSEHFYMRQMLHSEIAQMNGMLNAPTDPELAIYSGKKLCEKVLEPILKTWGPIVIRSAFRSEEVNEWGNSHNSNCASNLKNYAAHIWDKKDNNGFAGATACIVVPSYTDHYERTGDWMSLAWWLHRSIPDYFEICFFPVGCAFNIRWYEGGTGGKTIKSYMMNGDTGDRKNLVTNGVVSSSYNESKIENHIKLACSIIS